MRESFIQFMKAMDLDEFALIRDSEYGEKLTYINILHLYIIAHTERITVSELAEKVNMSRPAITQKVNDLERLGMIAKTRSETDKRVYHISIAPVLRDLLKDAKMATVIDAVDAAFSEEKKAVFAEILDFMTDYVTEDSSKEELK